MTKLRKTYRQKWSAYNQAQTTEKRVFYRLLHELLNVLPERKQSMGRPKKPMRDMIFACMIKTYCNMSSRRIISDLDLAKEAGYIEGVPHFNSLLNYFDDAGMRMMLHYLIRISALPLKQVEQIMAIDSTGFGTGRFDRWVALRNNFGEKARRGFVKAHVCCGVKTNIVTSAEITRGVTGDSLMFKSLLNQTAENFRVKKICADKAYCSRNNLDLADSLGAIPYIPFRSGMKGKGSPTWVKVYKLFTQNYEEFGKHYHARSNVESAFAAIKRKFGEFVRCKSERSQANEVLCKILAHNITCLVQETHTLGIKISFRKLPL